MSEERTRFWRFGVADLLAAVTAVGLWLGIYPTVRRMQPLIDPVFLAVLLTAMLGLALAAFLGRRQSTTLVWGCSLLAAFCAIMLAGICTADL